MNDLCTKIEIQSKAPIESFNYRLTNLSVVNQSVFYETTSGGIVETVSTLVAVGTPEIVCAVKGSIVNNPNVLVQELQSCGFVFIASAWVTLDVGDIVVSETKNAISLNEEDKLEHSFKLSFELPNTPYNRELLNGYIHPNEDNFDYEDVIARITLNHHIVYDVLLQVLEFGTVFSVTAVVSQSYWTLAAQNLKLKDVFGDESIEFTKEGILNANSVENLDYVFPLVDYGESMRMYTHIRNLNTENNNYVINNYGVTLNPVSETLFREPFYLDSVEFARPFFFLNKLIAKGFCRLGLIWDNKLSVETEKLLTYVIDKDYGVINKSQLNSKASLVAKRYNINRLTEDIQDVTILELNTFSNSLMTVKGYRASGEITIKFDAQIQSDAVETIITIAIVQIFDEGKKFRRLHTETLAPEDEIAKVSIEIEAVATSDSIIAIQILHTEAIPAFRITSGKYTNKHKFDITVNSGTFEVIGKRSIWTQNQAIFIRNLINPELTFLDILKGISHMYELYWEVNYGTGTITSFPAYKVDSAEGYYQETQVDDITAKVQPSSVKVINKYDNFDRYIQYDYSSVFYVGDLSTNLLGYRADLGSKFRNTNARDAKNPTFASFVNSRKFTAKPQSEGLDQLILPDTSVDAFWVPNVGVDEVLNWDLPSMITIGLGNKVYITKNPSGVFAFKKAAHFLKKNNAGDFIFHYYQVASIEDKNRADISISATNLNVAPQIQSNIAYGINSDLSFVRSGLVKRFHLRSIKENLSAINLNYLVDLRPEDFTQFDFRKLYKFNHLGRDVLCKALSVQDYRHCTNLLTPILFAPTSHETGCETDTYNTDGTGGGTGNCQNAPIVNVSNNPNSLLHIFNLGGVNKDTITNVAFVVILNNGTKVRGLTYINMLQAQYTFGQIPIAFVYAEVTYQNCPMEITPVVRIDLCDNNISSSIVNNCTVEDITTDIFIHVNFSYSGVGVLSFFIEDINNVDVPIANNASVLWIPNYGSLVRIRIDYSYLGCSTTSAVYLIDTTVKSPVVGCDVFFGLTGSYEDGTFLIRQFPYTGPYRIEQYVKYRTTDDDVEWTSWYNWDGTPIAGHLAVEAKLITIFDKDECPVDISDTIRIDAI